MSLIVEYAWLTFPVAVTTVFVSVIGFFLLPSSHNHQDKLKHAIITGGSLGIGFAIAENLCRRGVKMVTLVARNPDKLRKAQESLQAKYTSTEIVIVSADVCNYSSLQEKLQKVIKDHGPPTLLFCNAGSSSSGTLFETNVEEFNRLMQINYMGTVHTIKAVLPYMKDAAIVLTNSLAGQLGIYGYTAYSPTKAALILFAQSLQAEVRPLNISVTITFPPDTDTEGYQLEMIGKPEETKLISEDGGLFTPDTVANKICGSVVTKNPPFGVYFGLEGFMLGTLTAGMSPAPNLGQALMQICLMGLFRFVSLFYLWDHARIVQKCFRQKDESKKEK